MRSKSVSIEMKQNRPTSGKAKTTPKKSTPNILLSLDFDWDRKSQIKHMLSLPKEDQTSEDTEVLKKAFERGTKDITSNIIMPLPVTETEIDLTSYYELSKAMLGDYVTLDWQYIEEIRQLKDAIAKYSKDTSQSRPLNIMMQAEPGSGKSYFIKCLAKSMKNQNIEAVDFNMTTFENIDDFTISLDAVRNIKVNDKLPLLFLDEFDCSDRNFPILLPLLWDGELQVGQRDLKVGKVIIVLAGSGKNIEDVMKSAKAMHEDIRNNTNKLADLMSRIDGGELSIPNLDTVNNNRDRRVDKVCISIALLQNRFGGDIETVPWRLLSFISQTGSAMVLGVSHISSI